MNASERLFDGARRESERDSDLSSYRREERRMISPDDADKCVCVIVSHHNVIPRIPTLLAG